MDLAHWEQYYRSGAIASCPTSPEGEYDRDLRTLWEDFLSPLPADACILDIATGNGAIAGIAQRLATALGRPWQIHASDAAAIDPLRHVADAVDRYRDVRFHPHSPTERLPFGAAQFDAITGQYALEWSPDTEAALNEIARVLKPGGRALFVLAHADAPMVESARRSLRDGQRIFEEWQIFSQLRTLLATPNLPPALAQQQGLQLQATIREIKQAHARSKDRDWVLALALEAIRTLLDRRRQVPAAAMAAEIDFVEQDLRHGIRRLQDLAECACDAARMHAIEAAATAAGLMVSERTPQWYAGQQLVGWRLQLTRL